MDKQSDSSPGQATKDVAKLSERATLFNGITIENRLVKVAMEEGIGWAGGLPNAEHRNLYRKWGNGGWGLIVTGNVQVDPAHLATTHDLTTTCDRETTIQAYRALHDTLQTSKGLIQLSHPGLQSHILTFSAPFTRPVSSISARPTLGSGFYATLIAHVLYPVKARVLAVEEWCDIVSLFVKSAVIMRDAGWEGVQIHSAHGYLLAAYLSKLTNPNPSPLPNIPSHIPFRLHLLYLILSTIDQETPDTFILSVKLNCSDFVQGGVDEELATEYIQEIVSWGFVHILEISGGTYANPAFANPSEYLSTKLSERESMFAYFTRSLRSKIPSPTEGGPLILLTGGLHSRRLIADALNTSCDLAGIGRPAAIDPSFPRQLLDETVEGLISYTIPGAPSTIRLLSAGKTKGIPFIGAGVSTLWHEWQLARIGRGESVDLEITWGICTVLREIVWLGLIRWLLRWVLALFGKQDDR